MKLESQEVYWLQVRLDLIAHTRLTASPTVKPALVWTIHSCQRSKDCVCPVYRSRKKGDHCARSPSKSPKIYHEETSLAQVYSWPTSVARKMCMLMCLLYIMDQLWKKGGIGLLTPDSPDGDLGWRVESGCWKCILASQASEPRKVS